MIRFCWCQQNLKFWSYQVLLHCKDSVMILSNQKKTTLPIKSYFILIILLQLHLNCLKKLCDLASGTNTNVKYVKEKNIPPNITTNITTNRVFQSVTISNEWLIPNSYFLRISHISPALMYKFKIGWLQVEFVLLDIIEYKRIWKRLSQVLRTLIHTTFFKRNIKLLNYSNYLCTFCKNFMSW